MSADSVGGQFGLENLPRLVIAAPHGRAGKTTLTLGLLRALSRQGLKVRPFKKGPDYIDPSWLAAAAAAPCYNLDAYLMEPEQIRRSVAQAAAGCSMSIIEGAMGLFDGLDLAGSSSTAEIAKLTETPVILVLDATRMTRSAAAIVMGCQHFDPAVKIGGVILNKVAQSRHERMLREAIEHFCGVPVVGAIPKDAGITIPDRHLGLVTNAETVASERILEYLADVVAAHVDLAQVQALATKAPPLSVVRPGRSPRAGKSSQPHRVTIGVIRDEVFSFYYPENLEALARLGAELKVIDSLRDPGLPADLAALYIGGGFPEVFAAGLEQNSSLRREIKEAVEGGLPVYAECGGLMYLGRSLEVGGESYAMVGALPLDTVMEARPMAHGYTLMRSLPGNSWLAPGTAVKGHEFHNSRLINLAPEIHYAYAVERGYGVDGSHDGIVYKGVCAAYNHLHVYSCPEWAATLVEKATAYQAARQAALAWVAG